MKLTKSASAGTENKEDLTVTVEPSDNGIEISVESTVGSLFAPQIRDSVTDVLKSFGIDSCKVAVRDFSALDYTVRARTEAAVRRAMEG